MGSGDGGLQSEINVTPLVDVVLVLLIIFMVLVPLAVRGYDVDVPRTSSDATPSARNDEQFVLGIESDSCPILEPLADDGLPADCVVWLNDDPVSVTELRGRIEQIFGPRETEHRVLLLSAQDRMNYEGVMRIIDVAKSGVDGLRIGVVTDG